MNTLIESAKLKKANIANANAGQFNYPFYAAYSQNAARAFALFWSVFGPAARYGLIHPDYAYAASMKP